jgi:type I restriction enzyme S subunit
MDDDKELKEFENLPEGWKWVRLEDIAIRIKNIAPKGSNPYLEIGDVDINSKKYFIKDKSSPNHCIKAKKGEIIISKVRPTRGAISIIKEPFLFVSPAFLLIDFHNSKFLFYSLSRTQFFNFLGKLETGTTYPSVNDEDVLSYKLPLPPLPEQQKIAEILETVDNAIEKTDKIIEKYKRIKQGLMQDLLTKGIDENGNIRDEKTHKFKDSPLGRIPKEWEVVRLGEISYLKGRIGWHGLTVQEYLEEGEYYLVTGINFKDGRINWDSCVYVSKARYETDRYIQLKKDDILVTKDGTIGKVAYIFQLPKPATLGTGVFVLRPIYKYYYPNFFYYVLNSFIFDRFMENLKAGSTINHLYQKDFVNFQLPLPPLPEQQRIGEILSQIDETIEKEEKYKEKLERIKKGLMEDLLTGKVRVNNLIKKD